MPQELSLERAHRHPLFDLLLVDEKLSIPIHSAPPLLRRRLPADFRGKIRSGSREKVAI